MTNGTVYPTLAKLVQELRPLESSTIHRTVVDPTTGRHSKATIPAFLFRGESKVYPSIYSSCGRFRMNTTLSDHEKAIVNHIAASLDKLLRDKGLHPMASAALLRHYEFPTEIIDTTSSIDVAASFAISGTVANQPGGSSYTQ